MRNEKVDWDRVDAMSDEEIARQIARDPDVAPDMSEALESGDFEMVWGIDLEQVRNRTGLQPATFADRFGLPLERVLAWEEAGRVSSRAIWMYLKLIEREPELLSRAAEAIRRELLPKVPVG